MFNKKLAAVLITIILLFPFLTKPVVAESNGSNEYFLARQNKLPEENSEITNQDKDLETPKNPAAEKATPAELVRVPDLLYTATLEEITKKVQNIKGGSLELINIIEPGQNSVLKINNPSNKNYQVQLNMTNFIDKSTNTSPFSFMMLLEGDATKFVMPNVPKIVYSITNSLETDLSGYNAVIIINKVNNLNITKTTAYDADMVWSLIPNTIKTEPL